MSGSIAIKHPKLRGMVYFVRADKVPAENTADERNIDEADELEVARPSPGKPRLIAHTPPAGKPRMIAFTRTGTTRNNPHELPTVEKGLPLPTGRYLKPIPEEKPHLAMHMPGEKPRLIQGFGPPDWYYGLVDNTQIHIHKRLDGADMRCQLIFGRNWRTSTKKTQVLKFNKINGEEECASIWFCKQGGNIDNMNSAHLYLFDRPLDPDMFDYIALKAVDDKSHKPLILTGINIFLNNVPILKHSRSEGEILLRHDGVLDLSKMIRDYRLRSVPHSSNRILKIIALELGKAWSNKYQTYWRSKYDEEHNLWPDLPYNWCLEFASWVLNRVGIHTPQLWTWGGYDNDTRNLPANHVIRYLTNHCSYHNPKDTTYAQLGQKIRPGNFLWMKSWPEFSYFERNEYHNPNERPGHAAFFIRWCDPKDNGREVPFDPNKKINYFLTIAGNEGSSSSKRVSLDARPYGEVFSVYKGKPPPTITPSWAWISEEVYDDIESKYGKGAWLDGFASI
jgi:hypothetical protein